ncbi:hypothetical protein ACFXOQ_36825, partial [Streptomyces californicus]
HESTRVDIGFAPSEMLHGTLADVAAAHGPFDRHQVLICGSPAMVATTIDRLVAGGTPPTNITTEGA